MSETTTIMGPLPPLRRPGTAYLALLLVLVGGFYVLLLLALAATLWLLYEMARFTPAYLSHVRGGGALKLMIFAYVAVIVFGWAMIRGFTVKVRGDPYGMRVDRTRHPKVFALTDEVAMRTAADPIHEIFITPEAELGVWEEAALYLPPGMGKRKIVLGMAALNYLTTDRLRSILAHEYGHFSHRDTFFSRFIHRVSMSYAAVVAQLAGSKVQYLNPFFWLIRGYAWIYHVLAASFSRRKEYAADRFAVEAFGQEVFKQALIAAHVEGMFFVQVGLKSVLDLARDGKAFQNLYSFVTVSRKQFAERNPSALAEALATVLQAKGGVFDSHPTLSQRLAAQGVPATACVLPRFPRLPRNKDLIEAPGEDIMPLTDDGPPSAAEELLGDQLPQVQVQLSDMVSGKYHHLLGMAAGAQAQAKK